MSMTRADFIGCCSQHPQSPSFFCGGEQALFSAASFDLPRVFGGPSPPEPLLSVGFYYDNLFTAGGEALKLCL